MMERRISLGMSKGFFLTIAALVAAGYFYQQDPTSKGAGGGGALVTITAGSFETEVMASATPVVAYFWAPW